MSLFDLSNVFTGLDFALLTEADLDAVLVVHTPSTLPELFAAHDVRIFDVARALGVSFELVQRIVDKRQPLPIDLAKQLAAFLHEDLGTVKACAGLVTPITGPLTRVPLPPEADRGETWPAVVLGETAPPPQPSGGTPQYMVYVAGARLGDGAGSGVLRYGRNTGLLYSRTTLSAALTPSEIVTDGAQGVYTAGTTASSGNYGVAVLDAPTGELEAEATDTKYVAPLGMVWEPVSKTLWVCSSGTTAIAVLQVDPTTGKPIHQLTLTTGGFNYSPRCIVAHAGLLYITGRQTLFGSIIGALFEVDPVTRAVLRQSSGADLLNAWGLAVDPVDGVFMVASANHAGSPGPQIAKVVLPSFVASVVTLSGDPEVLGSPTWVTFAFGVWWVTDLTTLHGERLFRMTTAGEVTQSRSFGASSPGGHSAADPWFLWYADRPNGEVHLLNPADIGTSAVVIPTGGLPDGILVLPG